MIKIEHDEKYIFIHILTHYFNHEYKIMAPLSYKEARELTDALQKELQDIFTTKNRSGKLGCNDTCICIPNLPIMAGCPVHDKDPDGEGIAVTRG
jgi:hypothetical protein